MSQAAASAYTQLVSEAMLEFQVGQNILRGAAETVRCVKSLDIKITVDYAAKTKEAEERQKSMPFKISNLFSQK